MCFKRLCLGVGQNVVIVATAHMISNLSRATAHCNLSAIEEHILVSLASHCSFSSNSSQSGGLKVRALHFFVLPHKNDLHFFIILISYFYIPFWGGSLRYFLRKMHNPSKCRRFCHRCITNARKRITSMLKMRSILHRMLNNNINFDIPTGVSFLFDSFLLFWLHLALKQKFRIFNIFYVLLWYASIITNPRPIFLVLLI